jgi:hypothetical protein
MPDEDLDDKRPFHFYQIRDGDTVRVSSFSPISNILTLLDVLVS